MEQTRKIQPILNQVLIKLFEGDGVSEGGIVVPGSFLTESEKGTVIATGKGTKQHPMKFKEGDIVFRVKGHGEAVELEGERYYLMDQRTILAYGVATTGMVHH